MRHLSDPIVKLIMMLRRICLIFVLAVSLLMLMGFAYVLSSEQLFGSRGHLSPSGAFLSNKVQGAKDTVWFGLADGALRVEWGDLGLTMGASPVVRSTDIGIAQWGSAWLVTQGTNGTYIGSFIAVSTWVFVVVIVSLAAGAVATLWTFLKMQRRAHEIRGMALPGDREDCASEVSRLNR